MLRKFDVIGKILVKISMRCQPFVSGRGDVTGCHGWRVGSRRQQVRVEQRRRQTRSREVAERSYGKATGI